MTGAGARPMVRRSALLALPFQLGFVALTAVAGLLGRDVHPMLTLLLAVSLWAPALCEIVFRSPLPRALQVHYLLFITAGPYLGSALDLYAAIPYWDKAVHFDSGILLGWLGLLLVRRAEEATGRDLPRWFTISAIQATPMAFAAAWEICEFTSDLVLGTTAQNGLGDTMGDIIAATVGAALTILLVLTTRRPRSVMPPSLARERAGEAEAETAPVV